MRVLHPGRRGRALLGFAALDIVWGIRLATVHPDATAFYTWLSGALPLWVLSIPWFVVSVLCLTGAFASCDRVAFGGAIGLKVLWATLCACAQMFGVQDAWPLAALFAAFAWCVWVIAGTPEPIEQRGVMWTPPLQ